MAVAFVIAVIVIIAASSIALDEADRKEQDK